MSTQFSWDNPDVLELFDTYIHGFSEASSKMDKSHVATPEARSLNTLAKALFEKYNNSCINRHTVRHQIDKRKRALNIPKPPRKRKRRVSTSSDEREPPVPKKKAPKSKAKAKEVPQRSSSTSPEIQILEQPVTDKRTSRRNVQPSPVASPAKTNPTTAQPSNVNPPNGPTRAGAGASFLDALFSDNVRIEIVETLRRAQALMDAQIALTEAKAAYYERRNRADGIFDLDE